MYLFHSNFQMRMTQEVQSVLANSLLNDTIYEIVIGLMEIQHVTEMHLQQLRKQIEGEHLAEVEHWKKQFVGKDDPSELEHILDLPINRKLGMLFLLCLTVIS